MASDDLRARLEHVLANTAAAFLADTMEMSLTPHGEGRERHSYDGTCALCRGEVGTLLDAIMDAVLADRPETPGHRLRDLLDGQISQARFAAHIGVSLKHLNQVITGKVPLSLDMALRLEQATGVPAMEWNLAEAAYRTGLLRRRMAGVHG